MEWISTKDSIPNGDEVMCLVIVSGKPAENIQLIHAWELAEFDFNANGGEWIITGYPDWKNPQVHYFIPLSELPEDPEEKEMTRLFEELRGKKKENERVTD